ncbi:MAG: DUF86 domain-containing protein [Oscillospiraceae bacterium]|nr:DUF86 domain-containing protein [Oscillospiraceae bacterium]
MSNSRDIIILKKLIKYSNQIDETIKRFDLDLNKFNDDFVAKNAISMCILQIGELSGKLSDSFKSAYDKMPWRDIISLRNRTAHAYETVDTDYLWTIAIENVPELESYCKKILIEIENNEE